MSDLQTIPDTQRSTIPFYLPDADSAAELIWSQAMDACAPKMGLPNGSAVLAHLRRDHSLARSYCIYYLARQAAHWLALSDQTIRSIYLFDYDATPQDLGFDETDVTWPAHLIVWVERKTHALASLVQGIDESMKRHYHDLVGANAPVHILDVQIIDNLDVQDRIGYGAMLASIHQRPIQLWARSGE